MSDEERTRAVRRALSEWYESQRRGDGTLPPGDTDEVWAALRDLDNAADQPEPSLREHCEKFHPKIELLRGQSDATVARKHAEDHFRYGSHSHHHGANAGPHARPIGWRTGGGVVLIDLKAAMQAHPSRPKLKLFVWEDAFSAWWEGMAVALAHDVRSARREVAQKYAGPNAGPGDSMYDSAMRQVAAPPDHVIRLDENTKPQAWQVSGGG